MRKATMAAAVLLVAVPVAAVPPPPQQVAGTVNLAADNCPVTLTGTVRAYDHPSFRFTGAPGNVLLIAMNDPDPELVFGLSSDSDGPIISGAGFGEGDVRVVLRSAGAYTFDVLMRGDYARKGTKADFSLRLFLRENSDAGPCKSTS